MIDTYPDIRFGDGFGSRERGFSMPPNVFRSKASLLSGVTSRALRVLSSATSCRWISTASVVAVSASS